MSHLRARLFGIPDGYWPRFRCWFLQHDWWICNDACCDGKIDWCARCHTRRDRPEPHSPFTLEYRYQSPDAKHPGASA